MKIRPKTYIQIESPDWFQLCAALVEGGHHLRKAPNPHPPMTWCLPAWFFVYNYMCKNIRTFTIDLWLTDRLIDWLIGFDIFNWERPYITSTSDLVTSKWFLSFLSWLIFIMGIPMPVKTGFILEWVPVIISGNHSAMSQIQWASLWIGDTCVASVRYFIFISMAQDCSLALSNQYEVRHGDVIISDWVTSYTMMLFRLTLTWSCKYSSQHPP